MFDEIIDDNVYPANLSHDAPSSPRNRDSDRCVLQTVVGDLAHAVKQLSDHIQVQVHDQNSGHEVPDRKQLGLFASHVEHAGDEDGGIRDECDGDLSSISIKFRQANERLRRFIIQDYEQGIRPNTCSTYQSLQALASMKKTKGMKND